MLDGFLDNRNELTSLPRLGQIKIDLALVYGADDRVDVGVTRQQNACDVGLRDRHHREQFGAGRLRHALV